MVLSLVISNLYLYRGNYYGPAASFLVVSRDHKSFSATVEPLHRFDISFNMKGRQLHRSKSKEAEAEGKPVNLTTTTGETGGRDNWTELSKHRAYKYTNLNSTQSHHNHTVSTPVKNDSIATMHTPPTLNNTLRTLSSFNTTSTKTSSLNTTSRIATKTYFLNSTTSKTIMKTTYLNATSRTAMKTSSSNATSRTHVAARRQLFGYVLTLKVYEQQTMATGNLMQLQCFASQLNLSVVQPFMKDSSLTTPLDEAKHPHMLHMEDIYNMEEWDELTGSAGYAPLVKWEEFMQHAPRGVILVQMKYPTLARVKKIQESGKMFPHPLSESRDYQDGCGHSVGERAMNALKSKGFYVAQKVCYNFLSGDYIPLQIYQSDLWGQHNVTVIIDEWRGFGNQRVLIKEEICPGSAQHRNLIHSSSKIERDARRYVDKYLGNGDYLAVIARYEMTAISRRMSGREDPNAVIPICIQETLKHIYEVRKSTLLTDTFLSIDIGKYGSKSFVAHGYYGHQQDMESFVKRVYNNQMNITDWERSFESVAEKLDPGYIAKVQQAIVARAKCVVFVGGGSFQQHTLHLYQALHPRMCVRTVQKCTSTSRPIQ